MKVGCFFIDKEGVRHPDKFDIFGTNNKFLEAGASLKREPWILPKLSEVHVERKVLQNVGFGFLLRMHINKHINTTHKQDLSMSTVDAS